MIRTLGTLALSSLLVASFGACKKEEGPAEKMGRQIDESMQKAGEQLDESVEKAGQELQKMGEAMQDHGHDHGHEH